jgi:hypothetical protein
MSYMTLISSRSSTLDFMMVKLQALSPKAHVRRYEMEQIEKMRILLKVSVAIPPSIYRLRRIRLTVAIHLLRLVCPIKFWRELNYLLA